jgi:hypothetical protein
MRITEKYLREVVDNIHRWCPQITIQWAYDQPRIFDRIGHRPLSGRLPNREMDAWLDGFSKGAKLMEKATAVDPWLHGQPVYLDAYDNEASVDRYTLVFRGPNGWSYVGSSDNPTHPQGFWQHGEGLIPGHYHGVKIALSELPEEVLKCAIREYEEIYPPQEDYK